MDKYINVAEIAFVFKEEEVATQYGGKNDITTGILFALDTLELDMPESIVRCGECKYWLCVEDGFGDCTNRRFHLDGCADPSMKMDDFCSCGERRSDDWQREADCAAA